MELLSTPGVMDVMAKITVEVLPVLEIAARQRRFKKRRVSDSRTNFGTAS